MRDAGRIGCFRVAVAQVALLRVLLVDQSAKHVPLRRAIQIYRVSFSMALVAGRLATQGLGWAIIFLERVVCVHIIQIFCSWLVRPRGSSRLCGRFGVGALLIRKHFIVDAYLPVGQNLIQLFKLHPATEQILVLVAGRGRGRGLRALVRAAVFLRGLRQFLLLVLFEEKRGYRPLAALQ